jgi:hypothetical protein
MALRPWRSFLTLDPLSDGKMLMATWRVQLKITRRRRRCSLLDQSFRPEIFVSTPAETPSFGLHFQTQFPVGSRSGLQFLSISGIPARSRDSLRDELVRSGAALPVPATTLAPCLLQ